MIRKTIRAAALAAALLAATAASGTTRWWALQDVTFSDGAVATGSFAFDDVTKQVTSWLIRTQASPTPLPYDWLPFTYLPGDSEVWYNSGYYVPDPSIVTMTFSSAEGGDGYGERQLRITPLAPLDGTLTTVGINTATAYFQSGGVECYNCAWARVITGGSLVVVPFPPPVALVDVIEFHHAGLDHYVMSADPAEIAGLDTGVFAGWSRTGYGFKAYVTGSSASGSIHPVCRAYGLASFGLNTHFYSASTHECFLLRQLFGAAWAFESDNKFQIALPDTTTGVCPGGTVPVYRTFNGRADVNHRYTTSLAVRAAMEAAGWIREGYGAEGVIMCAVAAL